MTVNGGRHWIFGDEPTPRDDELPYHSGPVSQPMPTSVKLPRSLWLVIFAILALAGLGVGMNVLQSAPGRARAEDRKPPAAPPKKFDDLENKIKAQDDLLHQKQLEIKKSQRELEKLRIKRQELILAQNVLEAFQNNDVQKKLTAMMSTALADDKFVKKFVDQIHDHEKAQKIYDRAAEAILKKFEMTAQQKKELDEEKKKILAKYQHDVEALVEHLELQSEEKCTAVVLCHGDDLRAQTTNHALGELPTTLIPANLSKNFRIGVFFAKNGQITSFVRNFDGSTNPLPTENSLPSMSKANLEKFQTTGGNQPLFPKTSDKAKKHCVLVVSSRTEPPSEKAMPWENIAVDVVVVQLPGYEKNKQSTEYKLSVEQVGKWQKFCRAHRGDVHYVFADLKVTPKKQVEYVLDKGEFSLLIRRLVTPLPRAKKP